MSDHLQLRVDLLALSKHQRQALISLRDGHPHGKSVTWASLRRRGLVSLQPVALTDRGGAVAEVLADARVIASSSIRDQESDHE